MSNNIVYRADIDGLRAIAVIAVIFFHINSQIIPGGFIGVDIFFVISGFLITSNIHKQVSQNKFSFLNFYCKRIKRLLPLSFSVLLFCLIVGYFILPPLDYRILATTSIAANFFLVNVKEAFAGNYFQPNQLKPLLHLWSLSVEEQFYFIWPILFIFLNKIIVQPKKLFWVLVVIILSSVSLAEFLTSTTQYRYFSYFLLPTRMGELLVGCTLALYYPKFQKTSYINLYSIGGFFLILLSLFYINESSKFPGWSALLPTFGAALIIMAEGSKFNRILSNQYIVMIGVCSFSLYIWHWPILIFIRQIYPNLIFSLSVSIIFLICLFCISFISKKYIEEKFRYMQLSNKQVIYYYFLLPSAILLSFSFYIVKSNGVPQRYGISELMTRTETLGCHGSLQDKCYITNKTSSKNQVLLVGDSHAGHFQHFFREWAKNKDISILDASTGGCAFFSKETKNYTCETIKNKAERLLPDVDVIIIGARYDSIILNNDKNLLNEYIKYIQNLSKKNKKIIIINQVPKFSDEAFLKNGCLLKDMGLGMKMNQR